MDGIRRRALLAGCAGALTAALAGCSERAAKEAEKSPPIEERLPDLPVEEASEVYEPAIEEGYGAALDAGVASVDEFVAALEDLGIAVESTVHDETLYLEYLDEGVRERGVLREFALVAGAYAALVENEGVDGPLEATIVDPERGAFGAYTLDPGLAARFHEGELTAAEYGEEALSELETE